MSKSTNGTTFRRVGFLGAFAVAVLAMMPAPVAQARGGHGGGGGHGGFGHGVSDHGFSGGHAGDDLAASPRGVVAEPGTHMITVTRPGFRSKTFEVTARAGAPVEVAVDLEK